MMHLLPSLACPEVGQVQSSEPDAPINDPEGFEPAASMSELNARVQALGACRDRLTREGVHLDDYTSAANAADVNDVRLALGYSTVNLYGVSYGTCVALTVMGDFPQIVNSAIIDGVTPLGTDWQSAVPANGARAIEVLLKGCAKDSVCNAAFPDPGS